VSAVFEDDYRYEDEADDFEYIDDDEEEDENALWDDEDAVDAEIDNPPDKPKRKRKKKYTEDSSDESYTEEAEADAAEQAQRQIALEQNIIDRLEADAAEHPFEDDAGDEEPERKKLKRELRAEALARLEDAARTQRDFENVIAWWDKLDANRERRERYHELSRSGDDVPLDYGASANELFFPDTLNDVLEKQIRKGDFIDAIFYCPYDIHELVTEEYLSEILLELKEDHKELLFLWAVRLFSSTRIAAIRQQSDRNIRKIRNTMMKKIRKELLSALTDKAEKQLPMTLVEKAFLSDIGKAVDTKAQK
jgi:hypothetical protein